MQLPTFQRQESTAQRIRRRMPDLPKPEELRAAVLEAERIMAEHAVTKRLRG